MATRESWSEMDGLLAGLRAHDADPARVERIRARCLAALATRRGGTPARRAAREGRWGRLEPTFALGCGAAYLAAAAVGSVELAAALRGVLTLLR